MRIALITAVLFCVLGCEKKPAVLTPKEFDGGSKHPGGAGGGNGDTGGAGGGSSAAAGGGGTSSGGGGSASAGGGGTSSVGGGGGGVGGGTSSPAGGGGTSSAGGGGGGASSAGGGGSTGVTREVRFIAIGDTGDGSQTQMDVGAVMASWCADPTHPCDFVLMLGDNFYPTGVSSPTDPQWVSKFELPYAGVNAPFYVALGNHDYGGDGTGNEKAKGQFEVDYAKLPGQTKWKMPAKNYHFTAGNGLLEVFVADTNEAFFSSLGIFSSGFDDGAQRANLRQWVTASTATWKIGAGHHPYRSNGEHGNAGNYDGVPTLGSGVKSLLEDHFCGKADVYLCGHDHELQWLDVTCSGTQLIVSGGGHSTTTLKSSGSLGFNPTKFQGERSGFMYVVLQDRTFTGTFVGLVQHDDGGPPEAEVLYTNSFVK